MTLRLAGLTFISIEQAIAAPLPALRPEGKRARVWNTVVKM